MGYTLDASGAGKEKVERITEMTSRIPRPFSLYSYNATAPLKTPEAGAVCHGMCFTSSPRGALTSGYVPSLLVNNPGILPQTIYNVTFWWEARQDIKYIISYIHARRHIFLLTKGTRRN